MSNPTDRRLVVVTGAATGIGAAIADKLGSEGAFVVTLDANVSLDGSAPSTATGPATAERIIDSGGSARAANMSVTDAGAVTGLFEELVAEFGAVDAVVNVAGISRPTSFTTGTQPDWEAVLAVHLEGYLTVLRAALPIMAAAGHGRIVGVTSGSGWRPANAGAYGCAKRAVAALTWQLGKVAPAGVTINALSPIAATRMVTESLRRAAPDRTSRRQPTGGVTLTGFPTPDKLGPIGAYLAGDELSWCNGRVLFSAGAELALIAEPRLIEVVRSTSAGAAAELLAEVVPGALVSAETGQATASGSAARFVKAFDGVASGVVPTSSASVCIVADDEQRARQLVSVLKARGADCTSISAPARGISATTEQLQRAAEQAGHFDAVVIALAGSGSATETGFSGPVWQQVLVDHGDLPTEILEDAAWMRAAADYSLSNGRPLRLVALVEATTPGGRSRAQAAAQLSRASRGATDDLVSAVVISNEIDDDHELVAELIGHLVVGPDTEALSGAELCVGEGWLGLRNHPAPAGTVNFGGPEVPDWMATVLQAVVEGPSLAVS
jgi:NAD(P)-dependent dehydrogenase (short-subunit alcohol dehydrogenase family)